MAHTSPSSGRQPGTDTNDGNDGNDGNDESRHQAGLFDIRTFIAALIGIYGVVLVIMGLVGTPDSQLSKSDGVNINLWTGIALIVAAAVFQTWAKLRPVVVPDHIDDSDEERRINEG
jgi:hypothetical protein